MDIISLANNYGGIDSIFKNIILFSGAFIVTVVIIQITSLFFRILIPAILIVVLLTIGIIFGDISILNFNMNDLWYNVKVFIFYIYKFYIDILNASGIMALWGIGLAIVTSFVLKRFRD